jgi:hypothetical protein
VIIREVFRQFRMNNTLVEERRSALSSTRITIFSPNFAGTVDTPEVNRAVLDPDGNAPILRQPALGNVQPPKNLETRGKR